MQIGLIGLPMPRNTMIGTRLLRAGHQLAVYDADPEKAAPLLEQGARLCDLPADAACDAAALITCAGGPRAIEDLLAGSGGVLAGAAVGTLIVDLTVNDPATARRLAALAAERGVSFLDAPVSGGVLGAESSPLCMMVGGDAKVFEAHRAMLNQVAEPIFYLGASGAGATMKLLAEHMVLTFGLMVDELLVTGTKAGFDPETLVRVLSATQSGPLIQAPLVTGVNGKLARGFRPTGTLSMAAETMAAFEALAAELHVATPIASAAAQIYAIARGCGLVDTAVASLLLYERTAGVEVDSSR